MKLREFLKNLSEIVKADKSTLELDVVTAIDDDGNGFKEVVFEPSLGEHFADGDFEMAESDECKVNAICIN